MHIEIEATNGDLFYLPLENIALSKYKNINADEYKTIVEYQGSIIRPKESYEELKKRIANQ